MEENNQRPATIQDFQELAIAVGGKFEQVDKRFEQVDKRFDYLEQKMDSGFERLDKKVDTKFDFVVTKLDGILYAIEGQKQENIVGTVQLRRHTDTLENHEQRIKKLELQPQE